MKCSFFFQGLIDLDAEIAKCEKKLQLAWLNLDKVRKVEAQPDYVETVPENVRSINEDRVRRNIIIIPCAILITANPACRGKRWKPRFLRWQPRRRCLRD
jgi:hypothetical protein